MGRKGVRMEFETFTFYIHLYHCACSRIVSYRPHRALALPAGCSISACVPWTSLRDWRCLHSVLSNSHIVCVSDRKISIHLRNRRWDGQPVLQLTAVTNSKKPHVELTALDKPCENPAHAHNRQTTLWYSVHNIRTIRKNVIRMFDNKYLNAWERKQEGKQNLLNRELHKFHPSRYNPIFRALEYISGIRCAYDGGQWKYVTDWLTD